MAEEIDQIEDLSPTSKILLNMLCDRMVFKDSRAREDLISYVKLVQLEGGIKGKTYVIDRLSAAGMWRPKSNDKKKK